MGINIQIVIFKKLTNKVTKMIGFCFFFNVEKEQVFPKPQLILTQICPTKIF